MILLSVSSETFIRSFQLKLLNDIVFANKRLAKIGYVLHDRPVLFAKWKQKPSITYFTIVLLLFSFGKNFENFWFELSGKGEKFTLQDVYIGK